ncbi:MAG: RsmF rRNA methyltransferase first C-terminal domain-containing protein [Candidatus Lactobacillus pullistercoris]|uniref:RsmF rRNA methyltransferase first C-terminal domain-containing protein n=1 Tax=Candidatus Lactobacillus pullistercoris TaxID=2838636 RepID=A0A9E2KQS5_9LACO|nr:RsmF rRNA methyltransferase first C-terminal domain-containing protein [Candidatus Lactobacillus pullistercoris]
MLNLPDSFKEKYLKLLGSQEAKKLFDSLNQETKKAFRINSLKEFNDINISKKEPVPDIPLAYYGEVNSKSPEWVSGEVYSQDPAAMFPAQIAQISPGEKVLDLCAAPGGKTTALAESLKNKGLLVANEISSTRVKALRENLERWGVGNALITNEDSINLAKRFPQFFDTILVDAPCSGEGMFRKNPDAIKYWSPKYVLTCQKRQKEILTETIKMLKPGGKLVYSTCTFSPEEDEEIVAWLVNTYQMKIEKPNNISSNKISFGRKDFLKKPVPGIENTLRFWPQDNLGEGQFVAILTMPGNDTKVPNKQKKKRAKGKNNLRPNKQEKEYLVKVLDKFVLPAFLQDWSEKCLIRNDHVFIPAYSGNLKGLKIINNGIELGLLKKNRFEPGHQLAEVLGQVKQNQVFELENQEEFMKYLHGETINSKTQLRGFVLVSYEGFIFSFGKVTGNGILKNFYPKGLRIMKID